MKKGFKHSEETRNKMSLSATGRIFSSEAKLKMSETRRRILKENPNLMPTGEKHWSWTGGKGNCTKCYKPLTNHANTSRLCFKCWSRSESNPNFKHGLKGTKEYQKMENQQRKARIKAGGKLPIKRIQKVYEDNIKKYGTLTCIYCVKTIEFGKDTLDHKMSLFRGGTNEYDNLAVACVHCNCSKKSKTFEEFICP